MWFAMEPLKNHQRKKPKKMGTPPKFNNTAPKKLPGTNRKG